MVPVVGSAQSHCRRNWDEARHQATAGLTPRRTPYHRGSCKNASHRHRKTRTFVRRTVLRCRHARVAAADRYLPVSRVVGAVRYGAMHRSVPPIALLPHTAVRRRTTPRRYRLFEPLAQPPPTSLADLVPELRCLLVQILVRSRHGHRCLRMRDSVSSQRPSAPAMHDARVRGHRDFLICVTGPRAAGARVMPVAIDLLKSRCEEFETRQPPHHRVFDRATPLCRHLGDRPAVDSWLTYHGAHVRQRSEPCPAVHHTRQVQAWECLQLALSGA